MTLRTLRRPALAGLALLSACGGLDSSHPGVAAGPQVGTLEQAGTVCATGGTVEGIDVSDWQGSVNWAQVAASGRKFAFAKASQGDYFRSSSFGANWAGMKANGLVRGAYHWIDGTVGGAAQADYYLATVGGFGPGDLPPTIDWECNSTSCGNAGSVSNGQLAQVVADFIAEIKAKTGLPTIIYTSPGIYAGFGSPGQFGGDPFWEANWGVSCPDVPSPWTGWTFWQYSDVGSVPGIAGKVDLDQFNGNLAALDAFAKSDQPPQGWLDSVDCTQIAGWTYDPDSPSTAIFADVYFGGPAGSGATGVRLTAGNPRQDLCSAIGSCDHGYSMPTPMGEMDGAAHAIYVYGIDPSGNGDNPLLSGAPKSLSCPPPPLPFDPAIKRHIADPTVYAAWNYDPLTDFDRLPAAKIDALPQGADTPASPSLVTPNDGSGAVYLVDGQTLRHVQDPASMTAWHFDWNAIVKTPVAQVDAYAMGPPWPLRPYVVQGTGPALYIVDVPPFPPDAGTPADAGAPGDAGPAATDAGGASDAGAVSSDGGEIADGGTIGDGWGVGETHAIAHGGGCGCTETPDGLPSFALLVALGLASLRRRRP